MLHSWVGREATNIVAAHIFAFGARIIEITNGISIQKAINCDTIFYS